LLPDFPKEKKKLMERWNQYLVRKHQEYLGFFSTINSYRHYEGKEWLMERPDGSLDSSEYRLIEAEFIINDSEVPYLTPLQIAEKIDRVAEEMAKNQAHHLLQTIHEAAIAVGNIVDSGGQPLTKELFLKVVDRIMMEFDRAGNPQYPSIVMHPDLWESIKDDAQHWETDVEFMAKHKAILDRKREEWRVRENHRKLAD
jgi:hypothetical protein